jgi:hypothetical protein
MKKQLLILLGIFISNAVLMGQTATTTPVPLHSLSGFEYLLVSLPILTTVFVFSVLLKLVKNSAFNLKSALTERPSEKLIKAIIAAKPNDIEVVSANNFKALSKSSISRLIVLLSSVSIICIGNCLVCFYMFQYLSTGTEPTLENISKILLALGLGLAPYGFNKLSEALR